MGNWLAQNNISIPKYPGATVYAEHRKVALISHSSKVLLHILLSRMTKTAEDQISFGKKVRPRDQIFNIRMIREETREFNIPLYMAFISFKKTSD